MAQDLFVPRAVLNPPRHRVSCVSFSDEGQVIACGDDAGEVKVWDSTDFTEIQTWRDPSKLNVQAILWFPFMKVSGNPKLWMVIANRNGKLHAWVKLYRAAGFEYRKQETILPEGGLEAAAINSNGVIVATGAGKVVILAFDPGKKDMFSQEKVFDLKEFVAPVTFFNHERNFLVGLTEARTLKAYDTETLQLAWEAKLKINIGFVAWSDDCNLLAVSDPERGVNLYRIENAVVELIEKLNFHEMGMVIKQVDFIMAGILLVAGGEGGKMHIWEVPHGSRLPAFGFKDGLHPVQIVKASNSPKSQRQLVAAVMSSAGAPLYIWELIPPSLHNSSTSGSSLWTSQHTASKVKSEPSEAAIVPRTSYLGTPRALDRRGGTQEDESISWLLIISVWIAICAMITMSLFTRPTWLWKIQED